MTFGLLKVGSSKFFPSRNPLQELLIFQRDQLKGERLEDLDAANGTLVDFKACWNILRSMA